MRHNEKLYEGEHEAIIEQKLFDEVQSIFRDNRRDKALGKKANNPSLLAGLITDPDGRPMTPVHASRGAKRFRYYVTRRKPGEDKGQAWRLPAGEIETLVSETVANEISKQAKVSGDANIIQETIERDQNIADELRCSNISGKRKILLDFKVQVQVQQESVVIAFQRSSEAELIKVNVDAKLAKQGSDLKLLIPPGNVGSKPAPNTTLQKLVAQAFAAQNHLLGKEHHPEIADLSKRYAERLVRISWLAPDIIASIMDGTQPHDLTGRKLTRTNAIPLDWPNQRKLFGFA